jgi:hypothetical protein
MIKMNKSQNTVDPEMKTLFKIGGMAALLTGILFRRNIAAEVELFTGGIPPVSVSGWFALLQTNRLLGLTYLHFFDLVNYALLSLVFLALYAALKRVNKSIMTIASAFSFLGFAVYFASNTAFSMLALSGRYAAATGVEKTMLLSAGEAMLSINRFTGPAAHPGSGGLASLFFVALAGLMASLVMLRSEIFPKAVAIVGILAAALDLAYCLAYLFVPSVDTGLLAVIFIPAAGLFLMLWHILLGWRLYRLGK